jgi:Ni/Fe-hydrogenase subunit HybB-like protein
VTVWRVVFAALMGATLYATIVRFGGGLGKATNLSDRFPWGIWVGFDVMCGVGLAAGGFTIAAMVHIFNVEKYKPILRPTILTAFLGYLLVIFGLMFDLGRPYRIWHPLVMWNPHSVMFEVAWCVMLYTSVLAMEFAPTVFEKLGWQGALRWTRAISVPVVIAGVILSTLHQSSLGSLYLIFPYKLYPLWYTPLLPFFFYVSAICVGFAMTIFESWHSSRAFGRRLEAPLLMSVGRVLAVLLLVYLTMRFLDLNYRGALPLLALPRTETYLFALEIGLMAVPMVMLFRKRVRQSTGALYACAVMVIFGFVANRLNVSVTGMEAGSGVHYVPKWMEVAVTLGLIAVGFALFRVAAQFLPVFPEEKPAAPGAGGDPLAAAGR